MLRERPSKRLKLLVRLRGRAVSTVILSTFASAPLILRGCSRAAREVVGLFALLVCARRQNDERPAVYCDIDVARVGN